MSGAAWGLVGLLALVLVGVWYMRRGITAYLERGERNESLACEWLAVDASHSVASRGMYRDNSISTAVDPPPAVADPAVTPPQAVAAGSPPRFPSDGLGRYPN